MSIVGRQRAPACCGGHDTFTTPLKPQLKHDRLLAFRVQLDSEAWQKPVAPDGPAEDATVWCEGCGRRRAGRVYASQSVSRFAACAPELPPAPQLWVQPQDSAVLPAAGTLRLGTY